MPEYLITAVTGTENWTNKEGHPMVGYFVTIRTPEGREVAAKTNRRPASAAPTVGETIDGTLDPPRGNLPSLLRKNFNTDGGSRGGGGRSPQDTRAMSRSAAQVRALAYMQVKATMGLLKQDFGPSALIPLIEWFQNDVNTYATGAQQPKTVGGLPVQNEPQRTNTPEPTTPSANYQAPTVPADDIPFLHDEFPTWEERHERRSRW